MARSYSPASSHGEEQAQSAEEKPGRSRLADSSHEAGIAAGHGGGRGMKMEGGCSRRREAPREQTRPRRHRSQLPADIWTYQVGMASLDTGARRANGSEGVGGGVMCEVGPQRNEAAFGIDGDS